MKAAHWTLAIYTFDVVQLLDRFFRSVHINGLPIRVDQPAERRSIRNPYLHFGHHPAQAIAWRSQFHNEVRTQGDEGLSLRLRQGGEPLIRNPRAVRGEGRAVGKEKL